MLKFSIFPALVRFRLAYYLSSSAQVYVKNLISVHSRKMQPVKKVKFATSKLITFANRAGYAAEKRLFSQKVKEKIFIKFF